MTFWEIFKEDYIRPIYIEWVWFLFPHRFYAEAANKQERFNPQVYKQLIIAGWFPGRHLEIPSPPFVDLKHAAAMRIFREFGWIRINNNNEVTRPRGSSVVDVSLPDLEADTESSDLGNVNLCYLDTLDGVTNIIVDECGIIYEYTGAVEILVVANNFDEALNLWILGDKAARPVVTGAKIIRYLNGSFVVSDEIKRPDAVVS